MIIRIKLDKFRYVSELEIEYQDGETRPLEAGAIGVEMAQVAASFDGAYWIIRRKFYNLDQEQSEE